MQSRGEMMFSQIDDVDSSHSQKGLSQVGMFVAKGSFRDRQGFFVSSEGFVVMT